MTAGTKAIREALDYLENNPTADEAQDARRRARRELEAIRKAARALVAHHVSDVMVDRVAHSEPVIAAMTDSESQWFHPDVTAVSEATTLLAAIAKEEP